MRMRNPLATVTAGALIAAAALFTSACAETPRAETGAATTKSAAVDPLNCDAVTKIKADMRKLWTDHVVWTRLYVMEATGGLPGAQAAAARLMKNQEDIGDAVGGFYGADADDKLTTLLKEHITIAVDIVKAAKAGDKSGLSASEDRWQQNADAIAGLLSGANPNWPRATLADFLKEHLSTTKDEVVARLEKKWDNDVQAFDRVYDHMLKMSDVLSDGIVKQFPERFK